MSTKKSKILEHIDSISKYIKHELNTHKKEINTTRVREETIIAIKTSLSLIYDEYPNINYTVTSVTRICDNTVIWQIDTAWSTLMKNFYISVNNTEYNVVVEEIDNTLKENISNNCKTINEFESDKTLFIANGENIITPISGKIISIQIYQDKYVSKGDVLFVIESMQMQNEIKSNFNGTIGSINVTLFSEVDCDSVLASYK